MPTSPTVSTPGSRGSIPDSDVSTPGGQGAAHHPQAVVGEAIGLLVSALAAGKLAADIASAVLPLLRSSTPLVTHVLRSGQEGSQHVVELHLINATPHGMYLMGASLARPKGVPLTCRKAEVSGSGLGLGTSPSGQGAIVWPYRLVPGTHLDCVLTFDAQATRQIIANWGYGTLRVDYRLLSARDPSYTEADFAIRNEAP